MYEGPRLDWNVLDLELFNSAHDDRGLPSSCLQELNMGAGPPLDMSGNFGFT